MTVDHSHKSSKTPQKYHQKSETIDDLKITIISDYHFWQFHHHFSTKLLNLSLILHPPSLKYYKNYSFLFIRILHLNVATLNIFTLLFSFYIYQNLKSNYYYLDSKSQILYFVSFYIHLKNTKSPIFHHFSPFYSQLFTLGSCWGCIGCA